MTYDKLVSQVRALMSINNPSFDAWLPSFIRQAEERICREVVSLEMIKSEDEDLDKDIDRLEKSEQWKRPISCHYAYKNTLIPLSWCSSDFIKEYSPSTVISDEEKYPLFWADSGPNFLLFTPTPSQKITLNITYYARPDSLVDNKVGTTLSKLAPNALLYATLLEAAPFANDEAKFNLWKGLYESAVSSLQQVDTMNKVSRYTNRDVE